MPTKTSVVVEISPWSFKITQVAEIVLNVSPLQKLHLVIRTTKPNTDAAILL